MTRHAPVNILLLCVLFALGCSTKTATPFDLTHATELVASAGTEREVRLTGDRLAEYLGTFEPLPSNDLILHTTAETGTLTIGGESYPVKISHVKSIDRPATLVIDRDGQQMVYRQRAKSEPRLR
jgi:hypothetical protein